MSYYNTNQLTGTSLKEAWSTSNTQEIAILDVFRRFAWFDLTPDEILEKSGLNAPITSIRRAITDLTKQGLLEKTEKMKPGRYGKPTHCWKIKQ